MKTKVFDLAKKTAALLLAVLIAGIFPLEAGASAVQTASESSITISSDARYPAGALSLGAAFSIKGTVTSYYPLSKIWGGVYYTDGTPTAQYRSVKTSSRKFDIKSGFDSYIKFGTLTVGDYLFKLQATDNKGYTATLIDSKFSIRDNGSIPSAIVLTNGSLPPDILPAKNSFIVRGLVTSSYMLSKVWGGVYNTDGTRTKQYYEMSLKSTSTELSSGFGSRIKLGSLPEGSYTYMISAQDIRGYTAVLAEKSFTISADSPASSDIAVYNATYPTGVIPLGGGYSVKGVINSTYGLTRVSVGVYGEDGSPTGLVFVKSPGAKSFDLSAFDSSMAFGKLAEGAYFYRVQATDSNGYTKTLIDSRFTISSTARTDSSQTGVLKGIDVSSFQNSIDWSKVAASGLDFAIIRAATTNNSDANYMEDRFFTSNYNLAKASGLKLGAYIYTSAANKSEMKYNIDCLLRTLDGRSFDMPIYIDVEAGSRQSDLGKESLTDVIKYGCSLLRAAGYKAGVYANLTWFRYSLDADRLCSDDNEIWLAVWPDDPSKFDYSNFCVTWQYTDSGSVDGIEGKVDMDYRYVDIPVKSYSVIVSDTVNGTVTADRTSAPSGVKVTLKVIPDKGYAVKSVKYGGLEATRESGGTYSFTMPANDTTVTAVFERIKGDVNGDGVVNSIDLVRMMRYLSGEDVPVVEEVLDIDGSGNIDSRDLVCLLNIISSGESGN